MVKSKGKKEADEWSPHAVFVAGNEIERRHRLASWFAEWNYLPRSGKFPVRLECRAETDQFTVRIVREPKPRGRKEKAISERD